MGVNIKGDRMVEIVGVMARGQVWQARAWWSETRREWTVILAEPTPDWSRGHAGRGATLASAITELEQLLPSGE
jgi:hypothetical protein